MVAGPFKGGSLKGVEATVGQKVLHSPVGLKGTVRQQPAGNENNMPQQISTGACEKRHVEVNLLKGLLLTGCQQGFDKVCKCTLQCVVCFTDLHKQTSEVGCHL